MRGIFDDEYTDEELEMFYRVIGLGLFFWIVAETARLFI